MKDEVMVSILCTAYNHEKYIAKALDSFLMQKTNFKFEVIVHDDASTDNTAKIIKEYEEKYPEIIKPIYQTENQHSKKVRIMIDIMLPVAKGKYFAMCEGDDFWIDENKIQRQFDFLETHQDYTFCVHNSIVVAEDGIKEIKKIKPVTKDSTLTCKDFIIGGGEFVATNSIFAPMVLTKNLPYYFHDYSLDYFWQIYFSSVGKTYCFADYLSAYRRASNGSWTVTVKGNQKSYIQFLEALIIKIHETDEALNGEYHQEFSDVIMKHQINIYFYTSQWDKLKKEDVKNYVKRQNIEYKIKFLIKKIIYKLKNKF